MSQDNNEDSALVEALHRGDPYACDEMVKRFSSRIYNVALRLTAHPNEAEEVLQETFIKACRNAESFEGRSSLGTWLYRIAINNSLMHLRRRQTPSVSLDTTGSYGDGETEAWQLHDWYWEPESLVLTDELRQAMDAAVETLPERLRSAFVLRDLEGLSTKEAAEALDISSSNLKVRLHRARLLLRERLGTYFVERAPGAGGTR